MRTIALILGLAMTVAQAAENAKNTSEKTGEAAAQQILKDAFGRLAEDQKKWDGHHGKAKTVSEEEESLAQRAAKSKAEEEKETRKYADKEDDEDKRLRKDIAKQIEKAIGNSKEANRIAKDLVARYRSGQIKNGDVVDVGGPVRISEGSAVGKASDRTRKDFAVYAGNAADSDDIAREVIRRYQRGDFPNGGTMEIGGLGTRSSSSSSTPFGRSSGGSYGNQSIGVRATVIPLDRGNWERE